MNPDLLSQAGPCLLFVVYHRFIVASMPALGSNAEALSTLQPRAISNLEGRSAIATTNCDVEDDH